MKTVLAILSICEDCIICVVCNMNSRPTCFDDHYLCGRKPDITFKCVIVSTGANCDPHGCALAGTSCTDHEDYTACLDDEKKGCTVNKIGDTFADELGLLQAYKQIQDLIDLSTEAMISQDCTCNKGSGLAIPVLTIVLSIILVVLTL